MAKLIEVSGDSPVLQWLLASTLKASPWLNVTAKKIGIDWDMALSHWQKSSRRKALSSDLALVLEGIIPDLTFTQFHALDRPRWQRDAGKAHAFNMADNSVSVPKDVRKVLASLSVVVKDLLKMIDEGLLKKSSSRSRQSALQEQVASLSGIRVAIDLVYVQKTMTVQYSLPQRFAVAAGDIKMFHRGSSGRDLFGTSSASRQQRLDSLRLAHRLVRAQAEFYERLEVLTREGVPSLDLDFLDSELAESWKNLAQAEHGLALALNSDVRGRLSSTFVTVNEDFRSLTEAQAVIKQKPRQAGFGYYYSDQSFGQSPLAFAMATIRPLAAVLQKLTAEFCQKSFQARLEQAAEVLVTVMATLDRADSEMARTFGKIVSPEELDAAIDWLIASSPFLTLLSAGVLAPYKEESQKESFGIGLSSWLVTTMTAKKLLGTLPMATLGTEGDNDGGKDDIDEEIPISGRGVALSGRRIWELVADSVN